MHDIDRVDRRHLRQVQTESLQRRFEFLLRALAQPRPGLIAAHVQMALVRKLIAPAVHFHFNLLRQLAAQVFHMNTRAAVHIRRILPSHQTNAQAGLPKRSSILARAPGCRLSEQQNAVPNREPGTAFMVMPD